jgi:hypothetical protein
MATRPRSHGLRLATLRHGALVALDHAGGVDHEQHGQQPV